MDLHTYIMYTHVNTHIHLLPYPAEISGSQGELGTTSCRELSQTPPCVLVYKQTAFDQSESSISCGYNTVPQKKSMIS